MVAIAARDNGGLAAKLNGSAMPRRPAGHPAPLPVIAYGTDFGLACIDGKPMLVSVPQFAGTASMHKPLPWLLTMTVLLFAPLALAAAPEGLPLGAAEFHRYCAVCHVGGRVALPLTRTLVEGREVDARKTIMDGGIKMPGFKYELDAMQLERIVGYIKRLDQPLTLISVPRVEP